MVSQLFLKLWKRDLPLLHLARALQEFYIPNLNGGFIPQVLRYRDLFSLISILLSQASYLHNCEYHFPTPSPEQK